MHIDSLREHIESKEKLIRACFDAMSTMEDLGDRMHDVRTSLSSLFEGLESQSLTFCRCLDSSLTSLLKERNCRRTVERTWLISALERQLEVQETYFTVSEILHDLEDAKLY